MVRAKQNKAFMSIGVPSSHMDEIVRGKREITARCALRLARFDVTEAEFWATLHTNYRVATGRRMLLG